MIAQPVANKVSPVSFYLRWKGRIESASTSPKGYIIISRPGGYDVCRYKYPVNAQLLYCFVLIFLDYPAGVGYTISLP